MMTGGRSCLSIATSLESVIHSSQPRTSLESSARDSVSLNGSDVQNCLNEIVGQSIEGGNSTSTSLMSSRPSPLNIGSILEQSPPSTYERSRRYYDPGSSSKGASNTRRSTQTSFPGTPIDTGDASSSASTGEVPKLRRETRQVSDRPRIMGNSPLIKATHTGQDRVDLRETKVSNRKNRTHHGSPDLVQITLPELGVSEAVLNSRRRRAERAASGKVSSTEEYRRDEREKLWSSQKP